MEESPLTHWDADRNMLEVVTQSQDWPSDPRDQEVIHPAFNDPQIGDLQTPINSSALTKAFINDLPAYRQGMSPKRRGLEIGMAHGYWLLGPFAKFGPFRNTDIADLAGLASAVALIIVLTFAISLYASSNPPSPVKTVTVPKAPNAFKTSVGWKEFATGFLTGGIGGAIFAYGLIKAYLFLISLEFLKNLL